MILTGREKVSNSQHKIIWQNKAATDTQEKTTVQAIIEAAKVNITPNEKVRNLSGGMLQRLILNRELFGTPDLLILCHPLQGLDFNSSNETCDIIERAAEKGAMVLVISSNGYLRKIATRTYRLTGGHLELDNTASQLEACV